MRLFLISTISDMEMERVVKFLASVLSSGRCHPVSKYQGVVYLVYLSYLSLFSLYSYYKNKIFINTIGVGRFRILGGAKV